MQLAIQSDMLTGRTPQARCAAARDLGLAGVEVWAAELAHGVDAWAEAAQANGLRIAAVNYGKSGRLISADRAEREAAAAALRQALVNAVDLDAGGVVVVPHYGAPAVPDLTPYKSVLQLQYELLHNHLRTLSDYAHAMGTNLFIEPANHYETSFVVTLADGVRVRRHIKDHPQVMLATDTFHAALEEENVAETLRAHAADIGYLHLSDHNRRLPGRGLLNWAEIGAALRESGYAGWLTLSAATPGENATRAASLAAELPACVTMLREAGF